MTIFQFACDTNQTESVSGFHSAMLEWSTSWSLSSGQKRALYLLVRKSLHNSTKEEEARGFFLHYMRTFPSTVALPQDALALVIEGVVEFLNTPVAAFIERSSMLEILSPAQVAATAQLIHLRDLLSIVCLGNLTEYRSYIAKANNMQVLTSLKVDCTQLETNMRLLNLCTATMSVNKDGMSYDQVAAALDVSIDDVEMWIVTAIASGVLEANLNQSSRMMTITRCSYRAFGMEQWKEIQKKLTILRANVAGVYDEMVRSRRGN
jgi:translation initiation factor 3 subunit M